MRLRAYAGRVEIRLDGEIVANHARVFNRDRVAYDPWHYLPVLARKPGALRNGAPFKNWELPPALARVRRRLGVGDEADRQFVGILAAVSTAEQNWSKRRSKTGPLDVMPYEVLRVVPVVHRRDPRCFV